MSEENNNLNEQQNVSQSNRENTPVETTKVTTVGTWLITFLVLMIPIVGFIMTIVWMVSAEDKSRANYFKAMLIMYVIIVAVLALLSCTVGASMYNTMYQ